MAKRMPQKMYYTYNVFKLTECEREYLHLNEYLLLFNRADIPIISGSVVLK